MKKLLLLILALPLVTFSFSQTYKINKSTGKIILYLGKVDVIGYDGTEIVFTNNKNNSYEDERSKGLRAIDASGLEDNSGIGLNITEKSNVIEVRSIGKKGDKNYTIKVPKGMSVKSEFQNAIGNGTISISKITGEIEVAVVYNNVVLKDITGPLTVTSTYGKIDCRLSINPKGPISIVAPYGYIDLSIDTLIKANINLYAPYGEIFASNDIKIDMEKKNEDQSHYTSAAIKGKINGGGLALSLKSNWGKIYLRKLDDIKKLNGSRQISRNSDLHYNNNDEDDQ